MSRARSHYQARHAVRRQAGRHRKPARRGTLAPAAVLTVATAVGYAAVPARIAPPVRPVADSGLPAPEPFDATPYLVPMTPAPSAETPSAAYVAAVRSANAERPDCHLTWQRVAALAAATPSGRRLADTDGGAIDGDRRHDRAVGPMHLLPATWRRWGTDADGDGVLDPRDLADAATSAARYLCAAGRSS